MLRRVRDNLYQALLQAEIAIQARHAEELHQIIRLDPIDKREIAVRCGAAFLDRRENVFNLLRARHQSFNE